MLETLHYFSSTPAANNPFPKPPHFPSNQPNSFPLISCRRNLHFLPPSSKSTSIASFPPKPPKSPEIPSISQPPPPPRPNSEFQEKLLYLDSLGIDFLSLLTSHPPIVSTSISSIKSTISLLYSVGLAAPDLRRALTMCPDILTTPPSTLVPVFTFLLREAHVDGRDLRHVIHRRPRLLTCSVELRLRPTLYFLQSTIGICKAVEVKMVKLPFLSYISASPFGPLICKAGRQAGRLNVYMLFNIGICDEIVESSYSSYTAAAAAAACN